MAKITVMHAWDALGQRKPFDAGTLHAHTTSRGAGRLDGAWLGLFVADNFTPGRVTYLVYSYATPIAWVLDNGTVRTPDDKYSVTTTRHQTIVRNMLTDPKTFGPIYAHGERMRSRTASRYTRTVGTDASGRAITARAMVGETVTSRQYADAVVDLARRLRS